MTMHEGARAVGLRDAPCDECPNRKTCAASLVACDAFELYANGKPARMWRDAARFPVRLIARRLTVKWHGEQAAKELFDGKR